MQRDIIMAIRQPWTGMIFSREKPFEFRTRIGRDWAPGSKLFIYESKTGGGQGKVVGEATIDEIITLPKRFVGPPRALLRYWAEHVAKNGKDLLLILNELGDYELPDYKKGTMLRYLDDPAALRQAMQTGEWAHTEVPATSATLCEEWLARIGLFMRSGECYYNFAIKLREVTQYSQSKRLDEFGICQAPQSWMYIPEVAGACG